MEGGIALKMRTVRVRVSLVVGGRTRMEQRLGLEPSDFIVCGFDSHRPYLSTRGGIGIHAGMRVL